jgi:hypothetical protein
VAALVAALVVFVLFVEEVFFVELRVEVLAVLPVETVVETELETFLVLFEVIWVLFAGKS